MQMRRVGAGGTTSSPKHDKYLIRRNGNCQARLIVSHIIWREVANLDIAFDLSLSRSCLSLSQHIRLFAFSFLPPVATRSSSLCSSRTSRKPQFKTLLWYHTYKRSCVIEISLSCVFMPGVPHHSVLRPFFPFVLCIASYAILFFLFEEIRATQRLG